MQQLMLVSAGQLACGLAGLVVAMRRRYAYDIPFFKGSPDKVGRDALLLGTAYSAPAAMLVTQAVSIAALARREDQRAAWALRGLGAMMVPGHLIERQVRRRLTRAGWDRFESPLVAAGLGLASVMAATAPSND